MSFSAITFEQSGSVATITLNRPDNANTLNGAMARDLFDAAILCENDVSIRAVILTGTGKMFCAGGDLGEFHAAGDGAAASLTRTASDFHSALIRLSNMNAPLVVAVNGTAAGGGLSMMLCGDLIISSDAAKFVSAYTASGLTPDGSSTFFLAKHIGLLRAKELMFTNRVLSADEALDWGLVTRVVPADQVLATAQALAAQLAAGPTQAFGGLKRMLNTAYSNSIETQLEAETNSIVGMMRTEDGPAGVAAFLNKQKPEFSGK